MDLSCELGESCDRLLTQNFYKLGHIRMSIKSTLTFLGFAAVLCFKATISEASQYLPMVGKGVNLSETQTFGSCIKGIALDTETANIALQQRYREKQIRSHDDLQSVLEVSASVSAKAFFGSGSLSVSSLESRTFARDSFFWLVHANYELSNESIKTNADDFGLTDNAKRLLALGIEQFYAGCGTHFYSGRKVGGQYSILYEFKSQEDRSVSQLNIAANASGFGVEVNANFKKYLEMANKASSLTISSNILGGDHTIKAYPKSPEELTEQLDRLREKLIREGRGVVLRWYIQSYDQFPEVYEAKVRSENQDLLDQYRTDALARYYRLYTFNKTKIQEQETLITRSTGSEPFYIFSAESMAMIRENIRQMTNQNADIETRARQCLSVTASTACSTDGLVQMHVTSPEPERDLTHLGNWEFDLVSERLTQENSTPSFEFVGDPGQGFKARFFATLDRLFSDQGKAYVLAKHFDGLQGQVQIGYTRRVIDPKSGFFRPYLCIGDFDRWCNLRVIESPSVLFHDDGYPASKLQLTLFNELGFAYMKKDFLVRK